MEEVEQVSTTAHHRAGRQVALLVRFSPKPGKRDALLDKVSQLIERMSSEVSFIDAVVSQDLDHPDDLLIYESWWGTRESWLREEQPRPYRADYEIILPEFLASRSVEWRIPVKSWYAAGIRSSTM